MNLSDALLTRRYARAFVFARADNSGSERAALAELGAFAELLAPVKAELGNPLIPQEIKLNILSERLFSHKDTRAYRFLELLLKVKRFYLLEEIAGVCSALLDERDGIVRAEVETAFPPDADTAVRAERALAAATGKKVSVRLTHVPELIGGMRVRMGDRLIDASLQGRLNRLKRKITG